MWDGFDSDTQRQLAALKDLTKRRLSTPTHEWPVVFVKQVNALLVVREWPNGDLTAYVMPRS